MMESWPREVYSAARPAVRRCSSPHAWKRATIQGEWLLGHPALPTPGHLPIGAGRDKQWVGTALYLSWLHRSWSSWNLRGWFAQFFWSSEAVSLVQWGVGMFTLLVFALHWDSSLLCVCKVEQALAGAGHLTEPEAHGIEDGRPQRLWSWTAAVWYQSLVPQRETAGCSSVQLDAPKAELCFTWAVAMGENAKISSDFLSAECSDVAVCLQCTQVCTGDFDDCSREWW